MTTSVPSDRLETAPPLRKSRACRTVDVVLAGILISASLLHFSLFSRMNADVLAVFFSALLMSTVLSIVPLMLIRFLDRRERENPWLLAAAFLWLIRSLRHNLGTLHYLEARVNGGGLNCGVRSMLLFFNNVI